MRYYCQDLTLSTTNFSEGELTEMNEIKCRLERSICICEGIIAYNPQGDGQVVDCYLNKIRYHFMIISSLIVHLNYWNMIPGDPKLITQSAGNIRKLIKDIERINILKNGLIRLHDGNPIYSEWNCKIKSHIYQLKSLLSKLNERI